jgi:hypothetical protein
LEKDQPKPFVPPEPVPEVEERDDVRARTSPLRCPYCHSDVSPDARDWVACRKCLARHHATCWKESGACASCGELEPLLGRGRRWRKRVWALAAFAVLGLLWGGNVAYRSYLAREQAARFEVVPRFRFRPKIPDGGNEEGFLDTIYSEIQTRLRALVEIDIGYHEIHVDSKEGTLVLKLRPAVSADDLETLGAVLTPRGVFRILAVDDAGPLSLPTRGGPPIRLREEPALESVFPRSVQREFRAGRPVVGIRLYPRELAYFRLKNPRTKVAIVLDDEVATVGDLYLQDLEDFAFVLDGGDHPFTNRQAWALSVAVTLASRHAGSYLVPVAVERVVEGN